MNAVITEQLKSIMCIIDILYVRYAIFYNINT